MYRHRPSCLGGPLAPRTKRPKVRPRRPRVHQPPASESLIRWELVCRVRQAIADGTYETPAKWEAALDQLAQHLQSEGRQPCP
jgi:hypothetical protein